MSKVLDYLEELNIKSLDDLDNYMYTNDFRDIYNLSVYIRELINSDFSQAEYSPFLFVPSGEISGSGGCSEINCRNKRAYDFAKWSAFYADTVYLKLDFLGSNHFPDDINEIENIDDFLYITYSDLSTILIYKELIRCNIVKIAPVEISICPECLQRSLFGNKQTVNISSLKDRYCKKANITIIEHNKIEESVLIGFENLEEFFPLHTECMVIRGEMYNDILKQENFSTSKISSYRLKKQVIEDIVTEQYNIACANALTAHTLNAKYITSIPAEIDFFKSNYLGEKDISTNTRILKDYVMPYIQSDVGTILKLREIEKDAFNRCRISLVKALNEYSNIGKTVNPQELYDDLIYPEIQHLNSKVNKAKTTFKQTFSSIAILTGLLSLGVYTGIIPQNIASIIGAIDGSNFLYDLVKNTKENITNNSKCIKENDFYFLWKANNKSR